MLIESLELKSYRNYDDLSVRFSSGNNILYGDNAQGKTNILESLYVCSTTKSHRGSKDKELIKLGCDESHIRMYIRKNDILHRMDMHLRKNKPKGAAIDGIPVRRTGELMGFVNIVFFSPEDLSIIKNGPSERRRFIDIQLCQSDKIYLYDLINYNKVLAQRNNLLKQIGMNRSLEETLDIWDEQLVHYAIKVIKRRKEYINELNEIIRSIHYKLSGNLEELNIEYDMNVNENEIADRLRSSREKDIFQKITGCGPHRDDLMIMIKDRDLRRFGSQGQQRTCALSLKISEIEFIKKNVGDEPVLLLDDVLSELDRKRQNYLLESLENTQTIITCTGLEEFVENRFNIDKTFYVNNGIITEK